MACEEKPKTSFWGKVTQLSLCFLFLFLKSELTDSSIRVIFVLEITEKDFMALSLFI